MPSGKDFAAVAKDVADATPRHDRSRLLHARRSAAQARRCGLRAEQGEPTAPIQDELGWHILRITEIKPEATQPLDAVKDKLKTEVARDMAGDQIAKVANGIDDAIAGGASFADVVQNFNLKVAKVENVDRQRPRSRRARRSRCRSPAPTILRTAFATDAGQTSQLNEMGEDGYLLVQVDKVTPATVKPLDRGARPRRSKLWQDEKRNRRWRTSPRR